MDWAIVIIVIWTLALGIIGTITAQLLRRDYDIDALTWFNTIWSIGPKKVVTSIKIVQVGPFYNVTKPSNRAARYGDREFDEDSMRRRDAPVTFRLVRNGKLIDSFLSEEKALEKAMSLGFFADCTREKRPS